MASDESSAACRRGRAVLPPGAASDPGCERRARHRLAVRPDAIACPTNGVHKRAWRRAFGDLRAGGVVCAYPCQRQTLAWPERGAGLICRGAAQPWEHRHLAAGDWVFRFVIRTPPRGPDAACTAPNATACAPLV